MSTTFVVNFPKALCPPFAATSNATNAAVTPTIIGINLSMLIAILDTPLIKPVNISAPDFKKSELINC